MIRTKFIFALLLLVALALGAQTALAECSIDGTITASANPDPFGPRFVYTMVVVWDTATPYALSHFNLLMDSETGTCSCQDFVDALSWDYPIGTSNGEPDDCTVEYEGILECHGDPSMPGTGGILLKFEPIDSSLDSGDTDGVDREFDPRQCEPGTSGTGTFVFYSNLAPGTIDEDIFSAVDKYGKEFCRGRMSGDFPAMACDPVGDEGINWGSLKGLFR